jgi:hypothetical protein
MRSQIAAFIPALAATLLGACSDGNKTTEPVKPVVPLLVAVSEVSQQGIVDHEVASMPMVRVTDNLGHSVAGAHVVFTAGGLPLPTIITGADGLASVTWKLSQTAGTQTLGARLYSAEMAPLAPNVTFTAIALADTLAAIRPYTISDQSGFPSNAITIPPVVVAVDEFSNAKAGIEVTFEVTGGGAVAPVRAVTDAGGRANVTSWTLGTGLGMDTLIARVGSLAPVYFTARVAAPFVAKAIASGNQGTCAIDLNGDVYCWGANTFGEVNPRDRSAFFTTPQRVPLPTKAVSISGGYSHTCAITDQSPPQAWCWGLNQSGQLGSAVAFGTAPVKVPIPDGVAAVTTGAQHSCGLTPAGVAYCWGYGAFGQLGNGVITFCSVSDGGTASDCPGPTPVAGNLRFVAIAAGNSHTCGLVATGQMYCWGLNADGQLGAPSSSPCVEYDDSYYGYYGYAVACAPSPQAALGSATYTSLASGLDTCGLTASGLVACTGSTFGPRPVQTNTAFTSLAPDGNCGIQAGGGAYCWSGSFAAPQASFAQPMPVASDFAFSSLTALRSHLCGLLENGGTVVCWGRNDAGQLGNGSQVGSELPSFVISPPSP